MVFGEAGVGRGEVTDLIAAAEHQIRDRTRHERRLGLDQYHVDLVAGQQPHVFRGCDAALAAADHHDSGFRR